MMREKLRERERERKKRESIGESGACSLSTELFLKRDFFLTSFTMKRSEKREQRETFLCLLSPSLAIFLFSSATAAPPLVVIDP